jgi:transketolase
MLRSIPNFYVFRPADFKETVGAFNFTFTKSDAPVALALTRQNCPTLPFTNSEKTSLFGGYILQSEHDNQKLDFVIIATGSEVSLAIEVAKELQATYHLSIRVVSMPCVELFLEQKKEYQEEILPKNVKKVSLEAGSTFG